MFKSNRLVLHGVFAICNPKIFHNPLNLHFFCLIVEQGLSRFLLIQIIDHHSLWNMLQIIALSVLNSFYFLRTFYSTCLHIFVYLMCTVTLGPRSGNCNLKLIYLHNIMGQSYFIIFPTHLTVLFQNFCFCNNNIIFSNFLKFENLRFYHQVQVQPLKA